MVSSSGRRNLRFPFSLQHDELKGGGRPIWKSLYYIVQCDRESAFGRQMYSHIGIQKLHHVNPTVQNQNNGHSC